MERLILDKLNLVHPRLLTEQVLHNDCRLDDPRLSLTDLRGHLKRLEAKDQVVIVTDDDRTRIKITAAGIARLAE